MRVSRADDPYFLYLSIYNKCWEHRTAAPGNLFPKFVPERLFIGNTPSEQRRTAARRGGCAPCSPPVSSQPRQDTRQLIAVSATQVGPFLAEALGTRSPGWTHWCASPSPFPASCRSRSRQRKLRRSKRSTSAQRPAKGVHIFPHQPLALIGLHGFPLLILGQRVHFGREVELLTLPHIHESFRPDLEDLLVGQVPGLLLSAAGGLDRPEAAVAGGVPQIPGLGVSGAEEHALAQMGRGRLPNAAR